MVDLQNGSNDRYYGPLVNNPVDNLLTYQSEKDVARRAVEMSYEAAQPAFNQIEQSAPSAEHNTPARATELGQNAIENTVDSQEVSLTSVVDGSAMERTVGHGDLLIIGNNLEAVRLDAKAVNQMQPNEARNDKIIGIEAIGLGAKTVNQTSSDRVLDYEAASLPSSRQVPRPESDTQNDYGLAA